VNPWKLAALFVDKAVLYGPAVVTSVKSIWQTIQGEHPELRAPPPLPGRDDIDARIDARIAEALRKRNL
jgi:hypothetical protein